MEKEDLEKLLKNQNDIEAIFTFKSYCGDGSEEINKVSGNITGINTTFKAVEWKLNGIKMPLISIKNVEVI